MSAPRTPSAGRHLTSDLSDLSGMHVIALPASASTTSGSSSIFSFWNICLFVVVSIGVYYGYQYYLAYQQRQDQQKHPQDNTPTDPEPEPEPEPEPKSEVVYPPTSVQSRQPEHNIRVDRASALDSALNDASSRPGEPLPAPASRSGKSGWCLTGYDSGVNVCAEVGVNDTCMSGDIYPSQAICMNPSLRP